MKRSGARFDRRTFNATKRVNRGTMTRTRITPMNSIAPPRTGGFWGVNVRRKTEERKVIDVAPGTLVADTTGTITALNLVATGTDFTNRIGRKILMRSIYIRYRVNNFDNSSVNNCSRVILVSDMQTNGALPAITDVLDTIHAESQVNLNNRDRFRIIWDKIHAIGQFDTTATQAIAGSPTIHVGKSRHVFNKHRKAYRKMGKGKWFDGYNGQDTVIFEEFNKPFLELDDLLQIIDRYPIRVEVKGSSTMLLATTFVFTCTQPPWEWYPNDTHRWPELKRRITHYFVNTDTSNEGYTRFIDKANELPERITTPSFNDRPMFMRY